MIFCPSTNPPTNQNLTKSLTKSVKTGTPYKNVPPQKGRHTNQSISQNSLASPRRQTRGVCLCLARPCEAVSERERDAPRV